MYTAVKDCTVTLAKEGAQTGFRSPSGIAKNHNRKQVREDGAVTEEADQTRDQSLAIRDRKRTGEITLQRES